MKPLCCIYSNCQGDGLAHFMKQTSFGGYYDVSIWHNWQMIMKEQDPLAMIEDVKRAEVFIYQPATKLEGAPSTEDLCENYLPKHSKRISFPYLYNHGFFPWLKINDSGLDGWIAGEEVKNRIRKPHGQPTLYQSYNDGSLHHDCARRFLECLAEQARREQPLDVKMVPFILGQYREHRLFLSENHPTSALYVGLAFRVLELLNIFEPLSWASNNDAKMNGEMPYHVDVVRELGLKFAPDASAHLYYQESLERMARC